MLEYFRGWLEIRGAGESEARERMICLHAPKARKPKYRNASMGVVEIGWFFIFIFFPAIFDA